MSTQMSDLLRNWIIVKVIWILFTCQIIFSLYYYSQNLDGCVVISLCASWVWLMSRIFLPQPKPVTTIFELIVAEHRKKRAQSGDISIAIEYTSDLTMVEK